MWFATDGGAAVIGTGAYHFDGKAWTHFAKGNGLPFDEISSMAVAQDGAVWFSTQSGVARFDGKSWTTFNSSDTVGHGWVTACATAPDGWLWFGYTGSIAPYAP